MLAGAVHSIYAACGSEMSHILTHNGYRPLWALPDVERPSFPVPRAPKPGDEDWRTEQQNALRSIRAIVQANTDRVWNGGA